MTDAQPSFAQRLFERGSWYVRLAGITALERPTPAGHRLERLGSDYGGWHVPSELIEPGWVAYCGGVGEDVTFDVELVRLGCEVHSFDPTPRAAAHIAQSGAKGVAFHPVGLWSRDGHLRFYEPRNPADVSHSVVNLQGTSRYFEARVASVCQLMDELGHDHIDLLKIDIEGAEHEVIQSLVRDGITPAVLCVEFDQPMSVRTVRMSIERVRRLGYMLVMRDRWNFTFLHRSVARSWPSQ